MNGEAIYASQPWSHQNDSLTGSVWYTAGRPDPAQAAPTVFAILLAWPRSRLLTLTHQKVPVLPQQLFSLLPNNSMCCRQKYFAIKQKIFQMSRAL